MTILTPKEVSALLKDINFDSQQANSQQAKTSLSDFQQARAERNFLNVYSQVKATKSNPVVFTALKTEPGTKPFYSHFRKKAFMECLCNSVGNFFRLKWGGCFGSLV